MEFSQLVKVIGMGLAAVLGGAGVLALGLAAVARAVDGGPHTDLGYEDPTIGDSVIWRFIASVLLAAAGTLAAYVLTA